MHDTIFASYINIAPSPSSPCAKNKRGGGGGGGDETNCSGVVVV